MRPRPGGGAASGTDLWPSLLAAAVGLLLLVLSVVGLFAMRRARELADTLRRREAAYDAVQREAEQNEHGERRYASVQQEAQGRLMTLIADGAPLTDLLEAVASSIESLDPGLVCSIMLVDPQTHHLRVGAAPRLPDSLIAALDGRSAACADPAADPAALRPLGERLVVADILFHPYWESIAGAVEAAGVRSCWCEPIRDTKGRMLGYVDVYSRVPDKPDAQQRGFIDHAVSLVALALQHDQDRNARQVAEERASLLLESANEGVFGLDLDGVITFINPIGARLLGYAVADLVGQDNHGLIHHRVGNGTPIAAPDCPMLAVMRTGEPVRVAHEILWRRDGTSFPVEYRAAPIRSHGSIVGAVVIFNDSTERERQEQRIHRLAYFDGLTHLPNRELFKARLQKRLSSARQGDQGFALHFLDLDRFKDVNDTLGHPAGDSLLKEVAERLRGLVRATDTVARFGGDEFAVIQPDVRELTDAATLADKIVSGLAAPYWVADREVQCGASVGVVHVAESELDLETLLGRADVALYKAKRNGRGRYAFHTDEMTRQVCRDTALMDALDQAVRNGELFLHFQPQVELASGRITAVEALVRWLHPHEGVIPPGDFVHLAERRGLYQVLGAWVLSTAATQARRWHDAGFAFGRITINVSPQQVRSGTLADDLISTTQEHGIAPALLGLEFSETALLEYGEHHRIQVAALRDAGVHLTLDDFGTGLSSLTHLRRGGVSTLKIDRKLVQGIFDDDDKDAVEIVRAVLAVAEALALDTVAAGVETSAQAARLASLGCDCAQGRLFAPPLEPTALEPYLARGVITPTSTDDQDRFA
ncbi:EAL domain-containing protein [uncultured Lamprocystis sp.]|uniref:putative bifunctional diguanylate cyclase/phosphodiesterase n=1 Tax=uncultured Lamprocystis sp. TaxID=543132 RepID=UPI0025DCD86B|nr:EAL domain-containing protein [uncultured Lamprocystis sp.]